MKKKTIGRKILFSLLCICALLPTLLVAFGPFKFQNRGGFSTMGVIIGPIVLPEDPNLGVVVTPSTDNSSANLKADTPYANGALRAYKNLGVYNGIRDSGSWNGFKYASFCRYFRVIRDDGRYIYDDDGILDVGWDRANLTTDEIINYPAHFFSVETTLPIKSNAGFMWTDQQAKFKSGAVYNFSMDTASSTIECKQSSVKTNPTNSNRTLATIINDNGQVVTSGADRLAVWLTGTGQYENTFWGNTGGDTSINSNMTGYMKIANRDWSNELIVKNVGTSKYNGYTAYYSPKNYTVVARNLNNYVKLNDIQATSQYGTSIVPFKDGHHIELTDNVTKVSIEKGAENSYTTYYCFIDSSLPDISYNYHNANALLNRKVGSITTDSVGAKTQTITEGVFKDQVQIMFGYNADTEAPESATYTYNGQTKEIISGTWLSNEGDYTITITDLAGNKTISKFTIDKSAPSYNLNRLENDQSYKISKWYLTNVPSGYVGTGTYSFETYESALSLAKQAEYNSKVSSYTLSNVNDFTYTNLVANGDTVKVGDYWYYKSKDNPNLYVYYFDAKLLDEAIEHYAKAFVSEAQYYKINATLSPNNYGTIIDSSVVDNVINSGYIVNNFTFRFTNNNDTYKIYYDYQGDNKESWTEIQYGIPFISQVSSHGLYKIKEVDFVGHETIYNVYLDLNAPMLDVAVKLYGKDKILNQTISVADIPQNSELIYYYENFSIKKVIEDDTWWTMEVKCPDGKIKRYTYLDELPNFEELGSGEFSITIADRASNTFKFKVVLLGKAPEVKFETINTNTQLKITINTGESYNELMDLKIYRNGTCLNAENGYDEYPDNDSNSLIYINPNILKYLFNKGGIYIVEITDNFGRTLTYDYKFEKDLPTGILVGVVHNGKTKDKVDFIYDSNKYFVVVNKDSNLFEPATSTDKNITTLSFNAEEESEIKYSIQLVDKTDTENYNLYSFTIKTIKPILHLYGVEPNGKTGGNVYATCENNEEQYTATYSLNGETKEYRKGQNLTAQGNYTITLKDEIGNEAKATFEIDKTIDFIIADINGKTYKSEDIKYINFDIRIIESEPLNITITKDDTIIDYEFGLMITDEGYYLVRLNDEYNNSFYFTFTIDKTPPTATLYGVEEFGKTNNAAWLTSSESGLTCWYVRDEEIKESYQLGQEITLNGKYKVYVVDMAKNFTTFEFEIDKEIDFGINTYRGGISNGDVKLVAYENLTIVMYKDGQLFDYSFEQILNEEGEYSYTIIDELGNVTSSFFNIITKKKQNLNHILQEDISVVSVLKNDENFEYQILENKLYLYDEGDYVVNILDERTGTNYSFNIGIDTTPPTLDLIGVENGGTTKKVVVMKNVSEKPYTIYITVDGVPFEYKIGEEIEKCGRFEVQLCDEAGNTTTYTFERLYSLNGASIAVLAGLGALVVLIIILLVRSRHSYYKEEVIEEELEETIIEDDLDNGDDENPEND